MIRTGPNECEALAVALYEQVAGEDRIGALDVLAALTETGLALIPEDRPPWTLGASMNRTMIETVEAFDSREGLDVETFLAFADRVRDMAGLHRPGGIVTAASPEDTERLRREFSEASARPSVVLSPSPLRVVLTATTTMRGRVRKLTAKVEHQS